MKRYVFTVIIEEGNDEFWENITKDGKSGCDELREEIISYFTEHGFVGVNESDISVRLTKYEDII